MAMSVGVVSVSSYGAEVYNKNSNKLDLYGKIKAQRYISDDNSNNVDKTYARLGFKGETQINDLLTGFGRWEEEYAGNVEEGNTNNSKTRLAFAGLKVKNIGSLDYGRNLGILYDAEAATDMFPEFGGDSLGRTDNFMTKRTSGVATYRNTDIFGFVEGMNIGLQYQGKNDRNDGSKSNGDGYGASVAYNFGGSPVTVTGAYANSDRTSRQESMLLSHGSQKAEAWASSIKYDNNNIYLAIMYAESLNMTPIGSLGFANKAQHFEAVAQYQFDFGLRPSIGYVMTKGKDLENGYGNQDLVKYIDLGMVYYFNKNLSAMVDYKINQLDQSTFTTAAKIVTDDVVAIGVTYQF